MTDVTSIGTGSHPRNLSGNGQSTVSNASYRVAPICPPSEYSNDTSAPSSYFHLPGHATSNSIPQKRSFSDMHSAVPPSQAHRPLSSSPRAVEQTLTTGEAAGRVRAASSNSQSPEATTNEAESRAPMTTGPREETSRADDGSSQPLPEYRNHTISQGQVPALTTHSGLIARMVLEKRALAEKQGHRERLLRRQLNYQFSGSPGPQWISEYNEVNRSDSRPASPIAVSSTPPRAVTTPVQRPPTPPARVTFPPVRPTPRDSVYRHPVPLIFDTRPSFNYEPPAPFHHTELPAAHTPVFDVVSPPATRRPPAREDTDHEQPTLYGDSPFGSPFSAPVQEFLDRATNDAGLRGVEPASAISRGTSAQEADTPRSPPAAIEQNVIASIEQPPGIEPQVDIPPLFSDRPLLRHSAPPTPSQTQTITNAQTQSETMYSTPAPTPAPAPAPAPLPSRTTSRTPSLAPRPPPPPTVIPYYPERAGMPVYSRVEMNHNWPGYNNQSTMHYPPCPVQHSPYNYPPPPPPPHSVVIDNYRQNPRAVVRPGNGLPPAPEALYTYGVEAAAKAAAKAEDAPNLAGDHRGWVSTCIGDLNYPSQEDQDEIYAYVEDAVAEF